MTSTSLPWVSVKLTGTFTFLEVPATIALPLLTTTFENVAFRAYGVPEVPVRPVRAALVAGALPGVQDLGGVGVVRDGGGAGGVRGRDGEGGEGQGAGEGGHGGSYAHAFPQVEKGGRRCGHVGPRLT